MAELSTLFAKIHITKDNFDNFLESKPRTPKLDNNWLTWWNSRTMSGKFDLQKEDLHHYECTNNKSIIQGWKNYLQSLTFSDYDPDNEIWHFGIILFSENYREMIPMLAFIKSVAEFKTESIEDFATVYSYLWGGDVSAYINYENLVGIFDSKIQTTADIEPDNLKYADEYLAKKMEEFQSNGALDQCY
ncbi:hypothetical protein CLU81_0530 [Flavobacterium sp. 9]|uniref:hypothetical protein n=1 Tax=Flavobacterium sp. 9 TaxID=2035198 RepID=UPI000C18EC43|nr:hypothetical protein [Flavobacterium sp. 9]PIF30127.1 hypothetical protein CLU81_0530 [Flavobacterium sp. 9]